MEQHFRNAAQADSLPAVQRALGAGNRHSKSRMDAEGGGGPGQWKAAQSAYQHDNLVSLVEAFQAFGVKPLTKCFALVAKATGYMPSYVKKRYHERQ